jgi:dihydroorotate dehydrogenase electron transfer subunit
VSDIQITKIAGVREKATARIIENIAIAQGIYRLTLADASGGEAARAIAEAAAPGQFVNVYLNSASMLLPRPFGVSDVVAGEDGPRLVFIYAVVGAGPAELSTYAPGAEIRILGPQGTGYDLEGLGRNVILVGGGLGVPPLIFAARRIRESLKPGDDTTITALLGYRDAPYCFGEMSLYCDDVFGISERGSGRAEGEVSLHHMNGTVMDLAARLVSEGKLDLSNASVLSCGPTPMLHAVAEWAKARSVPAQISLEARMGCGYGACVGCTIEIKSTTTPTHTIRQKICKEGPVFPAEAIVW